MAVRIGILGGTFDPIHCGHVDVGEAAHAALRFDRLFVVTSNIPPHRPQPHASAYHRFAMTAMAVENRPGWIADDCELRVGAPSYTSSTLQQFLGRGYAPAELYFVIGADAFAEIESWYDYPALLEQSHFAVVSRPGSPVEALARRLPAIASRMRTVEEAGARRGSGGYPSPLIFLITASTADVSSTAIRRRIAAGDSIAGMVPGAVQQHIERHGLYASAAAEPRASDPLNSRAAGRLHGED